MVEYKSDRSIPLSALQRILPEEVFQAVLTATEPELVTVAEASERFKVPVNTIHAWVCRDLLTDYGHKAEPRSRPRRLVDAREIEKRANQV